MGTVGIASMLDSPPGCGERGGPKTCVIPTVGSSTNLPTHPTDVSHQCPSAEMSTVRVCGHLYDDVRDEIADRLERQRSR
jgi:hypothetical protein